MIKWIFNKLLTSKIKGNGSLMGKIAAADEAAEKLKNTIADREKRGLYVDPEIKKFVGLK